MQGARARVLPDGKRLHLQHGPIDLIIGVTGAGRADAFRHATARFATILQELVDELPDLRRPTKLNSNFTGPTAQRMQAATLPLSKSFLTPMAAVAGSVADEMLAVICAIPGIIKAYVNNGGDIAFYLSPGQSMTAAIAAPTPAMITLHSNDPWRGIATSGWRGRSHSLGIADSVTVLAHTAAAADAAATMIANAVDMPGDPRITRQPAAELAPDSDLGDQPVTTGVGQLDPASRTLALNNGAALASQYLNRHLIGAAYLTLQGDTRAFGAIPLQAPQPEPLNA